MKRRGRRRTRIGRELAKPLGGLGRLETMIEDAAALTGREDIDVSRRAVFVLCADNGVVAQGVSQTDQSVTRAVAENLAAAHHERLPDGGRRRTATLCPWISAWRGEGARACWTGALRTARRISRRGPP